MSPRIAAHAASFIASGIGKSGNPCARLIAPYCAATRVISRMTDSVKVLARLAVGMRAREAEGGVGVGCRKDVRVWAGDEQALEGHTKDRLHLRLSRVDQPREAGADEERNRIMKEVRVRAHVGAVRPVQPRDRRPGAALPVEERV